MTVIPGGEEGGGEEGERERDRNRERQRQTDRQTDGHRKTGRQAGRQTGRERIVIQLKNVRIIILSSDSEGGTHYRLRHVLYL